MNIKIQDENIITSDRYLNGNCYDLNEIIKLKNQERKKILLLSKITKNERRITSSKVYAPFKLNDEIRKKISLKHLRNKNRQNKSPINSINNIMIVNNFKIQNFQTENSSINLGKYYENINFNSSINCIDNNKSQISNMRKRINEIYGVSPKKVSRNIEIKIGGLESDRNTYIYNNLNTEGNTKKERKKAKLLYDSESKNQNFKFKNLNSEEREKIRKELENKLERQRSEIKKRERENSEKLRKKFLKELVKKKEKHEELQRERTKRKILRKKLDMILKRKEEASKRKILKEKLELQQKKLDIKNEIQENKLKREQNILLKQKEEEEQKKLEEEKIQSYIEELKNKAKEEVEIELKEDEMDNNDSKHKYRLQLLSELVKKYLEIYKIKDRENKTKILEIINKIGKIYKREIDYDKEFNKDNFIYISDAVQSNDSLIKFLGILGEEFRAYNIYSIIEKKSEDEELMDGIFKVLLCVYSILPKYEIKIDSEKLKEKFLINPKEWLNFIDSFKQKICLELSINDTKFFIISNRIDLCEFTFTILGRSSLNLQRYEKLFQVKIRKDSYLNM